MGQQAQTTGERVQALIEERSRQHVSDHEVLTTMERFGGSFASNLAKAWFCADSQNSARLRMAFPDLWEEYRKFATLNKTQVSA